MRQTAPHASTGSKSGPAAAATAAASLLQGWDGQPVDVHPAGTRQQRDEQTVKVGTM
jgi:hypothetical protein